MTETRRCVDIHSHVVFGADDGAGSLAEAIELLKLDLAEGADTVFATPHYGHENVGEPKAEEVRANFERLKERAAAEVPGVKLFLGTEWYCSFDLADRVLRQDAFRMNGTDYILTEFLEYGEAYEPAEKIIRNLMELKNRGFRPILAHAERYKAMQEDQRHLKTLTDNGILLQVNAYDLQMNLNMSTRSLAQWLATERMVSFIGSDMHGLWPKREPRLTEGLDWLYEHTDREYADAVAFGNAERLLGAAR